jgi:hypothetical protein
LHTTVASQNTDNQVDHHDESQNGPEDLAGNAGARIRHADSRCDQ